MASMRTLEREYRGASPLAALCLLGAGILFGWLGRHAWDRVVAVVCS